MSIENSLAFIKSTLEDLKIADIKQLDVRALTSITDYMLIGTGRSEQHVRASAQKLVELTKHHHLPPLSISGLEAGTWALVDYGDIIVHLMTQDTRIFYDLENLWSTDFLEANAR